MALTPVEPPLQARLFGNFSLTAVDGASVLPVGRKARALLACVLLAGDEGVSRERLASLLWSRSGEDQARASLRQALYDLRSLTAGDTPLLQVDRIRAKALSDRVRTDLDLLHVALNGADPSALADAVGDAPRELLADLNGIDDGFDDWLRTERQRRGDARRSTLLAVAEAGLAAGDERGARRLATALLATDATDETAARLAMRASQRHGDRDGVRQLFARLEKALHDELQTEPSAETREVHRAALAEGSVVRPVACSSVGPASVPGVTPAPFAPISAPHAKATSSTAPSSVRDSVPAATPAVAPTAAITAADGQRQPAGRSALATGIVIALASALAVVAAVWWWQHATLPSGPRLLRAGPLATSEGDSAAQALAGGFATDLARVIVGNDTTLAVVDPGNAGQVAQRRTDLLIDGDATTDAGTLRVNVKLRRASDATIVWSSSFARPTSEAAVLREQIATKVAGVLVCGFGGKRPAPDDFDAATLQLYLGACEQKYGDWAEAARLLQQVVARRPDYAHGLAMLAAGTSTAAYFRPAQAEELHRQALAYAERAIALDPNDGEAYFARADAQPGIEHWAERMAILEAGHAADPGNASVNGSRGSELAKVGRWHEAVAAAQQAADAEPFSPVHISNLARLRGFGSGAGSAEPMLVIGRARFPLVGYFARTEFRIAALLGDAQRAAAMLADPRYRLSNGPGTLAAWQALIDARIDPSPAKVELAVLRIREDSRSPAELLPALQKLVTLQRVEDAYAVAAGMTGRGADAGQELLFADLMGPFRADPRFMAFAARLGLVAIWMKTDRWPDFCADRALPYDCRAEAKRAAP